MRVIHEVTLSDGNVAQVREMTVGEIRAWLVSKTPDAQGDLVDSMLFKDLAIPDLVNMTNLVKEDLDRYPPSELRTKVIAKAKEVNPDFFEMCERVLAVSQKILAQNGGLNPLSAQSQD